MPATVFKEPNGPLNNLIVIVENRDDKVFFRRFGDRNLRNTALAQKAGGPAAAKARPRKNKIQNYVEKLA